MKKIKVLIVDDSELVREVLARLLSSDPQLEVVGTAENPYQARELIKLLNPDVLTLDVEMPRMNGIAFLRNLMRLRPTPVVMISTLTEKGADVTLEALELGAVDYVPKPKFNQQSNLTNITEEICFKVKQAAKANITALEARPGSPLTKPETLQPNQGCQLIAIGASTGGTEAVKSILQQLPLNMPPIVVVQHMPAGFTASWAGRLDRCIGLRVEELNKPRVPLKNNVVYIAHGAAHLRIERRHQRLYGVMSDGPAVNRHKPSVDVLFDSVSQHVGDAAVGVILTGMGNDGAQGMYQMFCQQALTIAQDEKSSVVWGMPSSAINKGAVKYTLPLDDIAACLVERCYG